MTDITDYLRPRPGEQPPYLYPDYGSTVKRAPKHAPLRLDHTLSEVTGPCFDSGWAGPDDADLTRQHKGEPIGERIIVAGRVLDEDGRAVRRHAGRDVAGQRRRPLCPRDATSTTRRSIPISPAPASVVTDDEGAYRFVTIKPGAYPWRNTTMPGAPRISISRSSARPSRTRLITQMYLPGDPLLEFDPIFQSIADAAARERLVARYEPSLSDAEWALGYRFDIVLRGREATPDRGV